MSRMNKLSSYKTTIFDRPNNKGKYIVYHETAIVDFDQTGIRLHSGGWQTVTTKRKMNQASNEFGLGYSVFQKAGMWFVNLPNGQIVPFFDGIFIRKEQVAA